MTNHEAVIVSGARTAIGTAYKGSLVDVDALELGTMAVAETVRRSGLSPDLVDDVVMGESLYGGGDIAPIRDMTITVGWNAAVKAGVTRQEMDAWAFRSHRRAVAGIDAGSFADEIFPIEVIRRDGTRVTFAIDEHPRRTSSLEKLASLKPLHPEIEGFSITAGNPGARARRGHRERPRQRLQPGSSRRDDRGPDGAHAHL